MNPSPQEFSDELISAYLDGELSPEEKARVENLLMDSPEHRRLFEELKSLRTTLHSLPRYELGEGFAGRVLQKAEREMLSGARASEDAAGDTSTSQPAAPPVMPTPAPRLDDDRSSGGSWRGVVWAVAALAAALLVAIALPWSLNPVQNGQVAQDSARHADESVAGVEERAALSTAAPEESRAEPRHSEGAFEYDDFDDDSMSQDRAVASAPAPETMFFEADGITTDESGESPTDASRESLADGGVAESPSLPLPPGGGGSPGIYRAPEAAEDLPDSDNGFAGAAESSLADAGAATGRAGGSSLRMDGFGGVGSEGFASPAETALDQRYVELAMNTEQFDEVLSQHHIAYVPVAAMAGQGRAIEGNAGRSMAGQSFDPGQQAESLDAAADAEMAAEELPQGFAPRGGFAGSQGTPAAPGGLVPPTATQQALENTEESELFLEATEDSAPGEEPTADDGDAAGEGSYEKAAAEQWVLVEAPADVIEQLLLQLGSEAQVFTYAPAPPEWAEELTGYPPLDDRYFPVETEAARRQQLAMQAEAAAEPADAVVGPEPAPALPAAQPVPESPAEELLAEEAEEGQDWADDESESEDRVLEAQDDAVEGEVETLEAEAPEEGYGGAFGQGSSPNGERRDEAQAAENRLQGGRALRVSPPVTTEGSGAEDSPELHDELSPATGDTADLDRVRDQQETAPPVEATAEPPLVRVLFRVQAP